MGQLLRVGVAFCLVLGMAGTAFAHCGGCGVGGEKQLEKTCAEKCAKDKAKDECIKKCTADHKKKKHSKK